VHLGKYINIKNTLESTRLAMINLLRSLSGECNIELRFVFIYNLLGVVTCICNA